MFVNIIGKAMNKKGMSAEDVAKKVGVKPAKVEEWMKEIEIPNSTYQARLSKVLGIPLCALAEYYGM